MLLKKKPLTSNDVNFKIKKDKHWFTPFKLKRYNPDYTMTLKSAPMVASEYVNKSIGVTRTLDPHKDSLRLGFRRDEDLVIHWYFYQYLSEGTRGITEIEDLTDIESVTVSFEKSPYGLKMKVSHEKITVSMNVKWTPKWMTHFYWGGDEFPNTTDSFWVETNIDYDSPLLSYYNALYLSSPLLATLVPLLAIFLLLVTIGQFSDITAVIVSLCCILSIPVYLLRNNINLQKWAMATKALLKRIKP